MIRGHAQLGRRGPARRGLLAAWLSPALSIILAVGHGVPAFGQESEPTGGTRPLEERLAEVERERDELREALERARSGERRNRATERETERATERDRGGPGRRGGPSFGQAGELGDRDDAEGGGGGPPTDDEIGEALRMLRESNPEMADRLERVRGLPDGRGRGVLERLVGRVREMRRLKSEDPEMYELKRRELPLMRLIGERGRAAAEARAQAGANAGTGSGDAKAADEALRAAIREGLTLKRSIRELEVRRLAERLEKAQAELSTLDLESEVEAVFEQVLSRIGGVEGIGPPDRARRNRRGQRGDGRTDGRNDGPRLEEKEREDR
ncbi:MAG: hypothetical protein AAF108_00490 [Planctomycetota bacterium]